MTAGPRPASAAPRTRGRTLRVVFAGMLGLAATGAATAAGGVLVLYSNDRLLPANIEIDRGLRDAIASSAHAGIDQYTEFLDQPAFSGAEYERAFASYLDTKYRTRTPSVILVAGGDALEFLLRHRARTFVGVPAVHLGIDIAQLQSLQPLPADVVGVAVEYDYARTVGMALRLHPGVERLVVITGASDWDREWEALLRAGLPRLGLAPRIEYLAGLPSGELLARVADLGRGDVVYTPSYFEDGAGKSFIPRDAVARIAAASGAPVYAPYSTFLGAGIAGGFMSSYVDIGRQAGQVAAALLSGAAPSGLRLPPSVPAVAQVDWRQILRWKVDPERIPQDAVVLFREPTFWQANRSKVLAFAAVIALQAVLIVALLVERRLRQRTASALAESELRMSLAARAARLSMWIWDAARDRFWTTNRLAGDGEPAAAAPMRFDQVLASVHPADRATLDSAARGALARGEEFDIEYRALLPDGEERWIAARGRAEREDGERLVGVALDVTPRKSAELQAAKDRAALTHMTRVSMLGQLSASIAHQLNQPLAAILGNAEAARQMLRRPDVDVAELGAICDDIISEDQRAADVIRRLGALYKRGELRLAVLDLNQLVSETLDLVRTELDTRHVEVAVALASAPPVVDGERVQLQQVLLNLILNGADAMRAIDPAQRRLLIGTEVDGATVSVSVVDRGTGIAPDDLKSVFDPFWSTKADGIGIGLAICQSIVSAHRGTLDVANNADAGATFRMVLPLRRAG